MDKFNVSDSIPYVSLGKLALWDVGIKYSVIGIILFVLVFMTAFGYAGGNTDVFTFNSLLTAIREIPQFEIQNFVLSRDIFNKIDAVYTNIDGLISQLNQYRVPDVIVGHDFFNNILNVLNTYLTGLNYFLHNLGTSVVQAIYYPLNFVNYIVQSMIQLVQFVTWFIINIFRVALGQV